MASGVTEPRTAGSAASGAVAYLLAARALRDFGDGFVAVLLPVYLLALGFSPLEIGAIATAALLGSALLTLGIGLIGARHDRQRLLLAGASLMIATGVAFARRPRLCPPAGGRIRGHDQSLGGKRQRVRAAGACGAERRGVRSQPHPNVRALQSDRCPERRLRRARCGLAAVSVGAAGVDQLTAIKAMFVLYALLGVAGCLLYARIPRQPPRASGKPAAALGPSRHIVYRLAALFSLDAFAGGFVVQSLLALWLFERFDLSLSAASLFFFWSGVLSAFSFPVAAWISRRVGLINTMVFTHIPSSLCLILAAFAPTLTLALALLLVRAALSQMDVPTRSSYVMAVVTEAERPAAASFTSVPRSLAAAASPAIAGALFAASFQVLPLLICGTLKIVYDLLLLVQFRRVKPPEEL